jgi:ATP-binding cassette subfamily C exporter for protease/lipase
MGLLPALLRRPASRTRLPEPQGRITGQQLVIVPPGATAPILKGLSFEIAPGEVVAVVGPSASGKSTLCRLLVGAWPPSRGSIRLEPWSSRGLGSPPPIMLGPIPGCIISGPR